MRRLRRPFARRWAACVLLLSLLPALLAPAALAMPRSAGASYADWLRVQVPASSEAFEAALADAEAAPGRTLGDFLAAFAAAYDARSAAPLDLLDGTTVYADALRLYLEGRLTSLGGDALAPPQTLAAAAPVSITSVRHAFAGVLPDAPSLFSAAAVPVPRHVSSHEVVWPLRQRFAARPLGP